MADLTRKEFAALCHTTQQVVNVNISRGKVILMDDGLIDSQNKINNQFFEKYIKRKTAEKKPVKAAALTPQKSKPKKTRGRKPKSKKAPQQKDEPTNREKQNDEAEFIYGLDQRKKKADAELQEFKAAHEKMKLNKLAGKLIPVDLVFQILNIHNKSIFATFQSDTENLASIFCEILAEGDRKKLSEITEKISENLLKVVEKSKEISKLELENAIEEYSETLNRGQRK